MRPNFFATLLSKFFFGVLSLFMSISGFSQEQEKVNWYVFGGFSTFQEDVDQFVGGSIGVRLGVGVQFNKHLGVEGIFDQAPALDDDVFIDALEDEIGRLTVTEDIEYMGNSYFSILGTASASINEKTSFIAKAGMTSYVAEITKGQVETFRYIYDLAIEETGTAGVVSVGFVIDTGEKTSAELSITNIFGDYGSLSFNGSWRYRF